MWFWHLYVLDNDMFLICMCFQYKCVYWYLYISGVYAFLIFIFFWYLCIYGTTYACIHVFLILMLLFKYQYVSEVDIPLVECISYMMYAGYWNISVIYVKKNHHCVSDINIPLCLCVSVTDVCWTLVCFSFWICTHRHVLSLCFLCAFSCAFSCTFSVFSLCFRECFLWAWPRWLSSGISSEVWNCVLLLTNTLLGLSVAECWRTYRRGDEKRLWIWFICCERDSTKEWMTD